MNQRRARFVDQDAVGLVDDGEVQSAQQQAPRVARVQVATNSCVRALRVPVSRSRR